MTQSLESRILAFAKETNTIIGICDAGRLPFAATVPAPPFVRFATEARLNPKQTMPTAQSIIVVGVGYRRAERFAPDTHPRGVLSANAAGRDYHKVVTDLLAALCAHCLPPGSRAFVDTGPLPERALAVKAGIARRGKSGNVISEKFGTFFNIGVILTEAALTPTPGFSPEPLPCGDCRACLDACPAGALSENGVCPTKCVSYLTQTKEPLTRLQMQTIGNRLYGCDVCQDVCPQNNGKYVAETTDIDWTRPKLANILRLTNSGFRARFLNTAVGWRGLAVLKRNAAIACVNSGNRGVLEDFGQTFDLSAWRAHPVLGCAAAYYFESGKEWSKKD